MMPRFQSENMTDYVAQGLALKGAKDRKGKLTLYVVPQLS
jgi:hypothetical protein